MGTRFQLVPDPPAFGLVLGLIKVTAATFKIEIHEVGVEHNNRGFP